MFFRFIAAAVILLGTTLPASALTLNKLPDDALTTAASRMKVKDFVGAREAALKSGDKGVRPMLLGMAALRLEMWEEAAAQLALAAESYPLLADYALYNQGLALTKLGRLDQALPPLYKLLKQYPDSRLARPALLLYGDALAAGGYPKEALQTYGTFVERYPLGSDALSALLGSALCRDKLGDPTAAAVILRAIWIDHPASAIAAKAAQELQRLAANGLKIQPYSNAELFKRACFLYDVGRPAQAAETLEGLPLAGESEEFIAKLRLKTGQALFKAKRYQEAQLALKAVVQKGAGNSANEASYWLARALDKSGKSDEAYEIYLRLAESPKGGAVADDALLEAAYLKRYQKKTGDSLQLFKRFVASHPDPQKNGAALWELAWSSYQAHDYQGAASFLRKLAEREDLREKALYWLGKSLAATGDAKGADTMYAALAAEYPFGYYALISNRWCSIQEFPQIPKDLTGLLPMPAGFEREKALITLGLFDEAGRELSRARKGKNPLGVARLYLEMENYNGALHSMVQDRPKRGDKDSVTVWGVNYPLAFSEEVTANAALNGIPESLVYAIMRTESNYLPAALSPVGAVGLMQIMPATAETISKGASARLATPGLNIRLGARHLKDLLAVYDRNISLTAAAYNAGSGNVKRWQKGFGGLPQDEFVESIPFRETREYVKKVVTAMELYQRLYRLPAYKN
jgi:soluble lytic murein transglycosylase